MFRYRQERTLIHNLKLASLLSLVAGMINSGGLLSVHWLTTNITGHFAFFASGIISNSFETTFFYGFFVLAFFSGAFVSSFLMGIRAKKGSNMIGTAPVLLECMILISLAFLSEGDFKDHAYLLACLLLFSMGLQNALVTTISNSIVRTTHLTGLFTDLGIELSQLLFYKSKGQRQRLLSSIKLHFSIIASFFTGILLGGWLYFEIGQKTFLLAAILLLVGLISRRIKFYLIHINRHVGN